LVTILPITHLPACAVSAVSEHKHPALALVAAVLTPGMKEPKKALTAQSVKFVQSYDKFRVVVLQ